MVAVNDVYELTNFVAKKQLGVSYLTQTEFNRVAPVALDQYIQSVYNSNQINQKATDDLSELRTSKDFTIPLTGLITLPTNYRHLDNIRSLYDYVDEEGDDAIIYREVKVLNRAEFTAAESSQLVAPSKMFPICEQYGSTLKFLPKDIGYAIVKYIRNPLKPYWNYTVVSGRYVYAATGGSGTNPNAGVTAGNSTDLELPSYCLHAITLRVCSLLGMNIEDQMLVQYSEQLKNENVP